MKSPLLYRRGIPFFYAKSEVEFQKDNYERYHEMVVKHSALHLADSLWGAYPMQCILDFAAPYYTAHSLDQVLEIGCGVGRWIAEVAQAYPQAACWGLDYSYQMLKRAHEYWVQGKSIAIDLSQKGFAESSNLDGLRLNNLNFGLAKAAALPFADNSQDLVLHSFLLDRLDAPLECMTEIHRVLKPDGTLIMVTPLNFNKVDHWNTLYPPIKFQKVLTKIGFHILEYKGDMIISEPLDARGNHIQWNCLAIAARKSK